LGRGSDGWALAIAPLVASKSDVVGAAKSAGGAFMASKTAYAVAAVAVAFAGGVVVRDVAGGSTSDAATQAEVAELRARLDAVERAKALTFQGIGRRVLRDFAGAEASFRDAATTAGPKTKDGRWAAYQVAWTTSRRGDARAAAEAFAELASDEDDVVRMRA